MIEGIGSELGATNLVLVSLMAYLGKRQFDKILAKLERLPNDDSMKRHFDQHEKMWIEHLKNQSGRFSRDDLRGGPNK